MDNTLLESRSSNGWTQTLNNSGIKLDKDGVVTKDKFIQYINRVFGKQQLEAWKQREARLTSFNLAVANETSAYS